MCGWILPGRLIIDNSKKLSYQFSFFFILKLRIHKFRTLAAGEIGCMIIHLFNGVTLGVLSLLAAIYLHAAIPYSPLEITSQGGLSKKSYN